MTIERDDTAMAFPAMRIYGAAGTRDCPDENTLVLLAEGVLDGADRKALDQHLDGCAPCSMLVAELARLAPPREAPLRQRGAEGRYKVIRQLGAGAMGVVWEAEDTSLHRKVALKFVKPEGADDRALRKRLLREARALAQVRHPNVMALYDAGETDDEVCLVLELIQGTNARVWGETTDRTTAEIVAVWKQAAAGIAAVHKAGIVHRDIKPDNVFVANDQRVLVGDFGLATGDGVDSTTSLTVSGAVIGTPLYMSPEQLQGHAASALSDQFALCASIWEMVVGERPFRGSTIAAVVLAMSKLPEIPKTVTPEQRAVLAIVQRGLDPDPKRRFPDVAALLAALEDLDRPPARSRLALWLGLGAVVLAVGGTVAVLAATRGESKRDELTAPQAQLMETVSRGVMTQPAPGAVPANPTGPADAKANPFPPATKTVGDAPKPKQEPKVEAAKSLDAKVAAAVAKQAPKPNPFPQAAPPPTNAPAVTNGGQSTAREDVSFTHLMQRAADKLQFGDGAGCLKLLAQLPEVPDDEMAGVELVKIECRMATGDCGGAKAQLDAYGAKHGWSDDRVTSFYEGVDKQYCPLEAPPQARWPVRAMHRLTVAAGLGRSCKPVLDAIKKHGIVLPDPKTAAFLEVTCMVNAGDCAGAKQKYRSILIPATTDPDVRPQIEASIDKSFHASNKKCPQ